jgi:hypothetical protein
MATKSRSVKSPLPVSKKIFGSESWTLAHDKVSLALTCEGGHLGPVTFSLGGKKIQPFHIAPWALETKTRAALPPVLAHLRGDFFCLPFGGNSKPWRGENHPVHGETANAAWTLEEEVTSGPTRSLRCSLATKIRPGQVTKEIFLREGESVVYQRHTLHGFRGPMNFGHHAMLQLRPEWGPAHLSTSRFVHGQVYPGEFESPAQGGYSSLRAGACFRSLQRIPLATGGWADWSTLPGREGFEDLVLLAAPPRSTCAWSAVAFPRAGFVWFALKNPQTLAATVLWHSHGGRHYPPWNGRHRNVLGVEEITGHFHDGLAESAAPNPLQSLGLRTAHQISPREPLVINYLFGLVRVPATFGAVREIKLQSGSLSLRGAGTHRVSTPVDPDFLDCAPGHPKK